MKRAPRFKTGSVVFDRRRKAWNLLMWVDGKRRTRGIGTLAEYPSKSAARRAAQAIDFPESEISKPKSIQILTVKDLVDHYRIERMPGRKDTRRSYEVWIKNHILPMWGANAFSELEPRPVELWLRSLPLAAKSKTHIRGMLSILWDYAMWRGDVPRQINPMSLVTIKGATKRKRIVRSLTVQHFREFMRHLEEPFRTIALLSVSFGLRISEALALKWADVDWLNGSLRVERAIVNQQVDEVKTPESQQSLYTAVEILDVLKLWKQTTQFSAAGDWMFASPAQLGRLPWSYDQVWRVYQKAAKAAALGGFGTHTLRHTYRTWLDSVGTPIGVQQKLMRHADIRTTMNVYGDAMTADMAEAQGKIVGLVLNGLPTDCKAS